MASRPFPVRSDAAPALAERPRHRRVSSNSPNHVRNQFANSHLRSKPRLASWASNPQLRISYSSEESVASSGGSSDSETPSTPTTERTDDYLDLVKSHIEQDATKTDSQMATTKILGQDIQDFSKPSGGKHSGTQLIEKYCCGGGCCFMDLTAPSALTNSLDSFNTIELPDNEAFRSLDVRLGPLSADTKLTNVAALPEATVSIEAPPEATPRKDTPSTHPPSFVQPHPPYHIFSAPIFHARELTKTGAEKRTFHFDIDVTDYPEEGDVDFKVGGAVGICPPNRPEVVEEIFDTLGVPKFLRDKPIQLKTSQGRWPTIWGEEQARELLTTRRELLTWCSDVQSYPPTKPLLRLLAEHATEPKEKKILEYLTAAQGQGAFCDLRTGPHINLLQLLHAFPSSKPPLAALLSNLNQLMPRFYSLSNDPHVSSSREGLAGRRLIEFAVSIHETPDWRDGSRTGVGSGFLERLAKQFIDAEARGEKPNLYVPLFRGLMANPLSKEFGVSNGPMMLIGAGVGMAPFRGFILNRLQNANCASKIWLVQGVRDSSVDELYSGELGKYESQIKKVVQSRRRRKLSTALKSSSEADLTKLRAPAANLVDGEPKGQWSLSKSDVESRYVQDEVRMQGDVVWNIVNSVDGRVFVCGSTKGMGEGVEQALVDIAVDKGGMSREAAQEFWDGQKTMGKYIAETW